ncbi:hypothetical protein KUTeg_007561 [Tegillarca granosa]|uniref:Tubulin polyglutamylase TTLL2 n=1 Tax=Tegillarca granosa TaxID=220873 RepID=A0ABQ9FDN5_TEGGR|nr:hypothetical protein KUTeg_007561 [Tegillarca granosa]
MTENKKAIVFRLNDHGQGPELIRQVFLERGWVEFDEDSQEDDDWNIWWRTSRFRTSDYDHIYQWQRLNHYPKSTAITKKDGLARNLKRMKGVHGAGVYNFSPIAFNLPNDYTRYVAEYSRLKQQHHDSKTLNWICKPADLSRGRGIFVFRDISELQYDCTAVVQRYISNPFLIGGYKFDIRIYVAVPSFHPLSIYVYQEGIVRFSTEKFDLNSLNNVFAHLTNTSINKHSPAYTTDKERIGPGCKWTISQLRYYFHQNNIDDNMTWIRIMNIVTLTMLIQAPQVPKTRNCFELYGFDILIDENLKPWLLEVNFSPALSIDCQSDVVVKKPMLHDLMDLMNFKEVDKERGGEHFRRYTGTSRSKGPDSNIDRYSSGSRLSHRGSTTHRNVGLHKNLSNLSKQTVQESVSYIDTDLHENKEQDKEKMCFGLPLIHPEEESKRKDSIGSSGISSADEENLKEIASETITRQKSATNSIRNASGNPNRIQSAKIGPRAHSGLSSSRMPNSKSISRETSQLNNDDNPNRNCNNNPVQNVMHTTTGPVNNSFERSGPVSGSNTLERTVTMSSVDKKPEEPKKPQVKGSIKSSATSDSGISSYSGSSENSDLSLKVQEEAEKRKVLPNRRGASSYAFGAELISEQTGRKNKQSHIKSLRPHGNSNALRKIQAGVVPVPQQPQTARSRSRLQSSMDSAPISDRGVTHQTNPRKSIQGRYTSRSVANSHVFRSQTRPTSGKQSKLGHHGDKENGHVVRRGFNNNSRLNGRIRAHGHASPTKPKSRGPPPRVGDFFLTFPFSEISLKSANSTLDPHQVIKEIQRLLKESLLPGVDKQESDSRKGFLPLGQFSDDPEARLWGPVKPLPEENS